MLSRKLSMRILGCQSRANSGTLCRIVDAPPRLEVPQREPPIGGALRVLTELGGTAQVAMICIAVGWFFMNTLTVTLSALEHGVRFFDLSAVIADPTRLFFDVDTPWHRMAFGLTCLACLAAPLTPHWVKQRSAWLCYLAPLALMLICAALLYLRTSGEFFENPSDANSLSGNLIQFANGLVRRGSDLMSRHISVGVGGYLALIGSVALAVQGVRRFRRTAPAQDS